MASNDRIPPVPAVALARELAVSASWLRREAEAGKLPHIRAGSQYLFDPALVRRILLERARQNAPGSTRRREEQDG